MKAIRFFSLVLLTLLFCVSYANEKGSNLGERHDTHISGTLGNSKVYVKPENVMFDKDDIYVRLNQNWVQTNALYSDAAGLYMIDSQGAWTCGRCNYYNTSNDWTCDNCGRRRE